MPFFLQTLGAVVLSYVIWLISGLGIAIIGFVGIMLILFGIHWTLLRVRGGQVIVHDIQTNQHYELLRIVREIQRDLRK